jgi:RNA polymerase subunit RPABC4/transcription elongation factor Spt4
MSKVVICANCKTFWHSSKEVCTVCGSTTLEPSSELNAERIAWVLTDPDNFQLGRQIGDKLYEFKEFSGMITEGMTLDEALTREFDWTEYNVDLNDYSEAEREKVAEGYYGSLNDLKEQCGDSWEWILAECIFEQETGLY